MRTPTGAGVDRTKPGPIPHAMNGIRDALSSLKIPDQPFDPSGVWENRYAIWVVRLGRKVPSERLGALVIRQEPSSADQVTLSVRLEANLRQTGAGDVYVHACRIVCRSDPLLTPLSWTAHTHLANVTDGIVPLSALDEEGSLEDGVVRITGRRPFVADKPVTTNWSLFAAVQRPNADVGLGSPFDLLEETDQPKLNHVLTRRPPAEVLLDGRKRTLGGYEHLGDGILPRDYWLDERGRLVLVTAGMRAYLMDPTAEFTMSRKGAMPRRLANGPEPGSDP